MTRAPARVLVTAAVIAVTIVLCAAQAQQTVGKNTGNLRPSALTASPRLVNGLSKCVVSRAGEVLQSRNLLLLDVDLKFDQAIGHCGCTSALLTYRVTGLVGGSSRELSAGELNTMPRVGKSERVYLLLTSDVEMAKAANRVVVNLGCSPPI